MEDLSHLVLLFKVGEMPISAPWYTIFAIIIALVFIVQRDEQTINVTCVTERGEDEEEA